MRAAFSALSAWLLCAMAAQAGGGSITPGAALAAARRQVESADYRLAGRLVRVEASGKRATEGVAMEARWFPGTLRVLLQVTSPTAARVHVLLEMRPEGRSTVWIAHPGDAAATELPFSKWGEGPLGGGFSYEDFLDAQYFWAGQKDLGETKFGARTCDQLRSTPGEADPTHYAAVTSWLDEKSGFPVYVEKTLRGSGTVKEFTYFGLRRTRGVWSADQVEEKIRGRAGSTLFIIDRGTPEAHLGLKDFDPARLKDFSR